MNDIVINNITIVFLIITILYSILNIISNKSLYNFIKEDYKKLNKDYKNSELYINTKAKYNKYALDNTNSNINISSFIEEMCTDFTFKDKGILERIKAIKNSSSTCVLIGVLGTFVGLSTMLLSINTNDIINSLPASINSMQTAFITSICGIICSIIINIFINRKDCESALVQLMLKLENLLTSEVTNLKAIEADNKIEELKDTIKQISKSIESFESLEEVSTNLIEFNKEFTNGIKALEDLLGESKHSIERFNKGLSSLDKQFTIINLKFNNLFDKYDLQEDISREILNDVKETSKYLNELNNYFSLYESNSQDLLLKLISHENTIINNEQNFIDGGNTLNNSIERLSNIVNDLSNCMADKINLILNYMDLYKEAIEMSSEEIYFDEDTSNNLDGDDMIND